MQSGVVYSQIDLKSIQRSMLIACKYLLPKTNTITKLLLPRMKYIIDRVDYLMIHAYKNFYCPNEKIKLFIYCSIVRVACFYQLNYYFFYY